MTAATSKFPAVLTASAIGLALLALFLVYFGTARSIVAIWDSSETFAHGYIILPISVWLIWSRRERFAQIAPAPYWPALLLLAMCGFAWLLADLGDVQVVRQYAFVSMIPAMAIVMLGLKLSWALAFPLLFLLLAVPFGDVFIEPLIGFTADFTVAAVQATGIPILREGSNFSLPTGNWSVVEACSGVRYLIASFTLGCLYAYLTYRSRTRQLLFVLFSIVVPIIANGLRAFAIVMIGHFSGMQLATGVDHLIYGWLFFGLIMFLMFWIGGYWREDQAASVDAATNDGRADSPSDSSPQGPGNTLSGARAFGAAFAVIACISLWPAYAAYLDRVGFNPAKPVLHNFNPSWKAGEPFTTWRPQFHVANVEYRQFFQNGAQKLGVYMLYYRNQQRGAELISSTNRLIRDKDPSWRKLDTRIRSEPISGRVLSVRETTILSAGEPLLVWNWYWIDGKFTSSDYVGKLLQAREKLLMGGDDGVSLTLFAPYAEDPAEARAALRQFLAENLPALEATLVSNQR